MLIIRLYIDNKYDLYTSEIIFVEGIPGSGKSTLLQEYRNNQYVCFYEHDHNNYFDLTCKAFLTEEVYKEFCEQCIKVNSQYSKTDIMKRISEKTVRYEQEYSISYKQIYFNNKELQNIVEMLSKYEWCAGRVNAKKYEKYLLDGLSSILDKENQRGKYCFEGALIQNPMLDFIGYYNYTNRQIDEYYSRIFKKMEKFEIKIIYLYTNDIKKTIERTSIHRQQMRWIEGLEMWIKNAPYIEEKTPVSFFELMQSQSIRILNELKKYKNVSVIVIDSNYIV